MYAVVFGLAVGLVLYVVGRPLISPDAVLEGFWFEPAEESAELEREKALATLAEVENDYQMNKLSAADYEELKARYTRRALALMQAPSARRTLGAGRPSPASRAAAARDARLLLADAEAEAEVMLASLAEADGLTGSGARFCHHCGAALPHPGQRFCHACGQAQQGVG